MKCSRCGGPSRVVGTSRSEDGRVITRRRRCKINPTHRFRTVEQQPLELEQIGVRQSGSGLVGMTYSHERLVDDLIETVYFGREKDLQRVRVNELAGAVSAALLRGEAALAPPDEDTKRRWPAVQAVVEDFAITALVEQQLATMPLRVQRVLYTLAIRGRNDRRGRQGWDGAHDVLPWLRREFPSLRSLELPRFKVRHPAEEVWRLPTHIQNPKLVIKRGSRAQEDFDITRFEASISLALVGRKRRYDVTQETVAYVLHGLEGQPLVHSQQLAVGVLNTLRRLDDIAYLRAAVQIKGLTRVTHIGDEVRQLIAFPSSPLLIKH